MQRREREGGSPSDFVFPELAAVVRSTTPPYTVSQTVPPSFTRGQPGRASELSRQMTAFLVRFAQFDAVAASLHPRRFNIFHSSAQVEKSRAVIDPCFRWGLKVSCC
jgi:hypothetical protein